MVRSRESTAALDADKMTILRRAGWPNKHSCVRPAPREIFCYSARGLEDSTARAQLISHGPSAVAQAAIRQGFRAFFVRVPRLAFGFGGVLGRSEALLLPGGVTDVRVRSARATFSRCKAKLGPGMAGVAPFHEVLRSAASSA